MVHTEQLFKTLEGKVKELEIELNSPATAQEIESLETAVNQKLPPELLDFYSFCNGFETNDTLFRVIPISEIISYKHELATSWFYFAEYMIYSDDWKVKLQGSEQYIITNDNHNSGTLITLTDSISEFLERYLTGGGVFGENGLYKWFDEINENKKNFT